MADYHRKMSSPRMMDDPQGRGSDYGNGASMKRDVSTATLLSREQQLREEIARLRREEQELRDKDNYIKQSIVSVREKLAAERRVI
ncbi:uncharacterized protein BYT42DRAFT_583375 [Radiomyces spectabilis]|uniref:uncharacterized protein n=1 Tax=Radiomyces spectabilis TaxID=64574 RepID=UPI00221F7FCE|nr:uncharacterized protein BYT42DRAFT_583375 [Radiomyces spectabilis]KAI8370695.1 hypothetical protein BYT42DRAFT_583375 [Radiomyces spectabilis]